MIRYSAYAVQPHAKGHESVSRTNQSSNQIYVLTIEIWAIVVGR